MELVTGAGLTRVSQREIEERLKTCPRLPSLGSISSVLRELLNADQRYTSQIADVIRRDPSLTARLLRLVNSVYFGFTTSVNSIEEAVFFLGLRQVRQLAMVTPVLEDFQKLTGGVAFAWKPFWQHCIATAILTQEILGSLGESADEVDYVAGLVHDVGKIVMAAVFPTHFTEVYRRAAEAPAPILELERQVLGTDHAALGKLYLRNHRLPEVLVEAAGFHHAPEEAEHHRSLAAAVQIANLLAHSLPMGQPEGIRRDPEWTNASGWRFLLPRDDGTELLMAQAQLKRGAQRLESILECLV